MIRIVYIFSTLKRTGPTSQLFNLIRNLNLSLFKPLLITLSPEPKESMWGDFEELAIDMKALDISRLKGIVLLQKKIHQLTTEFDPHIIHTQGFRADVVSSNLKSDAFKIVTVRNFPQKDFIMNYGYVIGSVMVFRQIKALKGVDVCVGVSKSVAVNLTKKFQITNNCVISNGVDSKKYFYVRYEDKKRLRFDLNLPINTTIWIVSGHLNERKDPVFLIKYWLRYMTDDDTNVLLFIGDGDLEHQCKQLIINVPNIIVLGRVNNVPRYLQAADFYLSSSKAEGLPNAALEAMACGLPVLLSDIDPHKELITLSPIIGYTYNINDDESFRLHLNNIIDANRENMIEASLNLIKDNLNSEMMSKNYQNIYTQLVESQ